MIVEPDLILTDLVATSKKHLLSQVSKSIAQYLESSDCTCVSVLDAMLEREKIGSTAIGEVVAIPHIRLSCLDRCVTAFVRLKTPIKFDAVDGRDVDLIYVFLAPENPETRTGALMHLARISHFFRDLEFCDMLRGSDEPMDLIRFRNNEMLEAA